MNRINVNFIWLVLLVATSCAISKKENERIEKLLSQQSTHVEIPHADSLTQEMLRKYENRAIQKLEDFYDYLGLLGNKNYGASMKQEIVISAQSLFYDPDTGINPFDSTRSKNYSVATCLENQQKATIEDFSVLEIGITDSLKLKNSNHYEGMISYLLALGQNEDRALIQKQAIFSLRKINKKIGNDSLEIWEVLLERIE